jgi:hypothetical protein
MQKILLSALLAILTMSTSALADIKVKSRVTMSGQSYESASYIKGKRQRTETMNGMMTTITQCDFGRSLVLYPQTKTYMVNLFDDGSVAKPERPTDTKSVKTQTTSGGVVTTTTTIKDTGERKQMFGYTARHLIITMETESSPDACNKTKTKMETDGWYIDFANDFSCQVTPASSQNYKTQKPGGCMDKYQMKTIGTAKRGYPVIEKMTMYDEGGKPSTTMLSEVLEISKAALEDSLFDVPADYREVKDMSEMYAGPVNGGNSSGRSNPANSYGSPSSTGSTSTGIGQNVLNPSKSNSSASSSVGAKKEGSVRIGLAGVKTGTVGEGLNAAELAAAVQNTLGEYLKGTKVELVALEAKLPSAQEAEAKEKECDFILQATVSHKKGGGGGFGMFKKIAPVLGNVIPMAGGVAGSVASSAIYTAAGMAGNVKAKDEITLDIKLLKAADKTEALAKQYKQKAKSDGDDIISPVIEQTAQAIIDTVGN